MSAATTAPSRPASAPAKSPTASSAPSDLQLSARRLREYQEYSAAHIQDTVQDMMTSLFTESPLPDDPLSFMLDFLTAKKGSSEGDGGKTRALLMRLNRAAGQLDAAALSQLVAGAERQAAAASQPAATADASSTSPAAAAAEEEEELEVTFTESGSLGMKMNDHEGSGRALIVHINAGTQAEKHQPQLKAGLVIKRVGSTSVAGMTYKSVLGLLKAAGRPCTITFVPLESETKQQAAAPPATTDGGSDLAALKAAAEAAEQKAIVSRNLRQSRQRRKGMSIVAGDGTPSQAEMEAALAATD